MAAIENATKRIATMQVVREKASKPEGHRRAQYNGSLTKRRQGRSVFAKQEGREGSNGLTTRQAHGPMTSLGVA